jgi:Transposase domain (DUF772)
MIDAPRRAAEVGRCCSIRGFEAKVERKLALLDLSWVYRELAPYYSHTGRPSIDPVLMIRMLIVGYVFAIRSGERNSDQAEVDWRHRRANDDHIQGRVLLRLGADRGYLGPFCRCGIGCRS